MTLEIGDGLGLSSLFAFLGARSISGLERGSAGRFERLIGLAAGPGVARFTLEASGTISYGPNGAATEVAAVARNVFDLDAPPDVDAVLRSDPALEPLVRAHPGRRVPGAFGGAELAIRAVIGQQVSVTGARTLIERLVVARGTPVGLGDPSFTHLFPAPEELADAALSELGMPETRRSAIRAVARALAHGSLDLRPGADPDRAHDGLTAIPGIGEWTASYVRMRALRDRNAFLVSDLGVRKGAAALGLPTSRRALLDHSRRWEPYRAYAVMYLWDAAAS